MFWNPSLFTPPYSTFSLFLLWIPLLQTGGFGSGKIGSVVSGVGLVLWLLGGLWKGRRVKDRGGAVPVPAGDRREPHRTAPHLPRLGRLATYPATAEGQTMMT